MLEVQGICKDIFAHRCEFTFFGPTNNEAHYHWVSVRAGAIPRASLAEEVLTQMVEMLTVETLEMLIAMEVIIVEMLRNRRELVPLANLSNSGCRSHPAHLANTTIANFW